MQIRIAKSQREDKTAYVAVRAGEMTGFAAVRYDLRSLLRYAGVTLAALIALRRLLRICPIPKKAPTAVGAFPLPCTRLDKQGETP